MAPIDHSSRAGEILAILWTFTGLSLIFVLLRVILRSRIVKSAGKDDFVVGLSMFFSLLYTCFATNAVVQGTGRHQNTIIAENGLAGFSNAVKSSVISFPAAALAFSVPKLAVVMLVVRTFEPPRWHRWGMYILVALVVAAGAINMVLVFVQCDPAPGLWQPQLKPKCWDSKIVVGYSIFTSTFCAFTDFFLALYPVTRVVKLQMSMHRKIVISVLMGLGGIAGVMAIIKGTKTPSLGDKTDYTWSTASLLFWTSIESNVLIIAASIPALGPLFRIFRDKVTSKGDTYGTHGTASTFTHPLSKYRRQSSKDAGSSRSGLTKSDEEMPEVYKQVDIMQEEIRMPSVEDRGTGVPTTTPTQDRLKLVPDGYGGSQYHVG